MAAPNSTTTSNVNAVLEGPDGLLLGAAATDQIGFYGKTPVVKPTVSGAKGGNAALTSLIAQLVALGLLTDTTS